MSGPAEALPPPPGEALEDLPEESRSLYADAWRRLLKNRMAVACGLALAVQSLLVVLSSWIAPFEPDHNELWVQEQAPGFTHPDVTREMRLELGEPIGMPARSAAAAEKSGLLIRANRAERREVRVNVSRGKVRSMLIDGREPVDEVVAGSDENPDTILRIIPEGEGEGATISRGRLATGEPIPDWLVPPADAGRRWVVILELRTPARAEIEVKTEGGVVTLLREDGEDVHAMLLRGRDVVEVLADGEPVTHTHWLGTDGSGRDLYSRILFGGWISLMVGLVATLVSLAIGVIYGAASGYFGGRVDTFMMAVVDILYAVPYMFLVILLLVMFGRSIIMLFIALGAVQWLTMARIVRGQVLSLKEKEFVEAAKTCGAGHAAIIFRHLIPNTLGIIVVYTTLTIPAVILQEAFLAFIGLNVEYGGKAIDSWGALVSSGRIALGADGQNWWLLVFPAVSLAIMLFSLNFLGDGLRDAFDPKMRGRQ